MKKWTVASRCPFTSTNKGFWKTSIVIVDTDVVVVAFYHFFSLKIEDFWEKIVVGLNHRWLPMHR